MEVPMIRRFLLVVILVITTAAVGFAISELDETVPSVSSTVRSMATYQREERAKINEVVQYLATGNWQVVTTATEAEAGDRLIVDTSDAVVTITLPASPTVGDEVWLYDKEATWATHNVTVGRNGSNINGAASDYTASTSGMFLVAIYSDATWGWSIVSPSVGNDSHTHTAATLPLPDEDTAGVAEVATDAEVATGTDDTRMVTPKKLATAADSWTIDAATTGAKQITISQSLSAGLYYLAAANQGGGANPTIRSLQVNTGIYNPVPLETMATTSYSGAYWIGSIGGAFPSTITSPFIYGQNPARIQFRVA
jgi:hypothetical protein